MNCKNCGNEIVEGALFCGVCGAKVAPSTSPEQNAFANQESVENPPVNQPDSNTFMNDSGAANQENFTAPAKTKGKFPKMLLYVGIPLLAVVVAVALCFNSLAGFFIENFGSNAAYFAYVEGTSLSGYSEALTSVYSKNQSAFSEGIGTKNELKVELGDSLKTMLSSYLSGMDLNWLNQIKLVGDTSFKDNKTSANFDLVLGEQTILTLEFISEATANTILMRCKELNDKYISLPVNSASNSTGSAVDLSVTPSTTAANLSSVSNYLPSEEELNEILKKYITIALKEVTNDDVTKESGEVTANGISENCTVLKLKVTEKLLLNIAKAILTEAETDKDILAVIEKFEKGVKEATNVEGDAVEEYKKGVAEALENTEKALEKLDGNGAEYFALTDYVNSSHEIIGRELSVNNTPVFKALSAEKGNDLGFELTVSDQLSAVGTGKKSGNSISGDYAVTLKGKELLTLSVENLTLDLENSISKGAIEIKLGKDVGDLMDGSSYTAVSLLNLSLRMEMDASSEKSTASISLLSGESVWAKISLDSKISGATAIETPAENEIVKSTEIDISDFDFSKIMENLQKAGVPQNLLTLLQYAAMAG